MRAIIGTVVALIIGFIVLNLPLGFVAISGATFYGAFYGWHWEMWEAVLLTAPGLIFAVAALLMGGAATVFSKRHRNVRFLSAFLSVP